ncbi:MAG: molybdopterin molybdotransferase MoeA [Acidimicrobiia bacterium]|nr:molybdopterin molybdotransferase MoeA [Acidimicrobiia bacterium]
MKEQLTPLEDAQLQVLASLPRLDSESIPLSAGNGRVSAENVVTSEAIPPFRNSAMDGYAVIAEDLTGAPVSLDVIAGVAAGSVTGVDVRPGAAIKIMTGAPVPDGADSVVPVELTSVEGGRVTIHEAVATGNAIRQAGSDLSSGTTVLQAGVTLTAYHLGVLASIGHSDLVVSRLPSVAIMSTGNEVMSPQTRELEPGQIRDSNRTVMRALLEDLGVDILDFGILADDPDIVGRTLTKAAAEADVVVTSGGVSMGEFDYVRDVMARLGAATSWKVAMQPAKPFTFGTVDGTPVFGLPGNPVSVSVAFEQFLRPGLLSMMGADRIFRPRVLAVAETAFTTAIAKTVFLRVCLRNDARGLVASLAGGQGSHQLGALADADGLAVVERGIDVVPAGSDVWVELHRAPAQVTLVDRCQPDGPSG